MRSEEENEQTNKQVQNKRKRKTSFPFKSLGSFEVGAANKRDINCSATWLHLVKKSAERNFVAPNCDLEFRVKAKNIWPIDDFLTTLISSIMVVWLFYCLFGDYCKKQQQ